MTLVCVAKILISLVREKERVLPLFTLWKNLYLRKNKGDPRYLSDVCESLRGACVAKINKR